MKAGVSNWLNTAGKRRTYSSSDSCGMPQYSDIADVMSAVPRPRDDAMRYSLEILYLSNVVQVKSSTDKSSL